MAKLAQPDTRRPRTCTPAPERLSPTQSEIETIGVCIGVGCRAATQQFKSYTEDMHRPFPAFRCRWSAGGRLPAARGDVLSFPPPAQP